MTGGELFAQIYEQVDLYLDLAPEYKALICAQILETYIQFKLHSVGYIFISGIKEAGKSRVCELIYYMGYRPMLSLNNNSADVYNYIGNEEENEGQVTIIEDEVDWKKLTPDLRDKMKIYRSGYRKGATVPRILEASSANRRMLFFRTYCSKVFGGYGFPYDDAFKSRCIEVPMIKGEPVKDEIEEEDKQVFDEIKLNLLIWRMATYFDDLPEREFGWLKGRMKEIWKCKILAVADTKAEEIIAQLSQKDLKEKFEESRNTLEAFVLQVIIDLCEEWKWRNVPFKTIWALLMKDLNISYVEAFREETYKVSSNILNREVSKNAVGRILSSFLHGKPSVEKLPLDSDVPKTERVWQFKKETIQRIAKSYKITARDLK